MGRRSYFRAAHMQIQVREMRVCASKCQHCEPISIGQICDRRLIREGV